MVTKGGTHSMSDIFHFFVLFGRLSTPVNEGDVLNILTNWYQLWDENDENVELAIIDRTSGFVVVQPDTLISGTSLVTSLVCRRKAVLAERFKLREFTDGAMLRGTLVHRLFQKVRFLSVLHFKDFFYIPLHFLQALLDKTADIESLQRILAGLLGDPFILKELFGASVTADEMEKEVNEFIPSVKSFIECYFLDGSQQKLAENNQTGPHWGGRIESVCDIEDNWWSPRLGVKGKVDVTVQVQFSRYMNSLEIIILLIFFSGEGSQSTLGGQNGPTSNR